jgi:AraC family transcriptional regulator
MAESQSARLIAESPLVRVFDVVCFARRSGYGAVEFNRVPQIAFPRRGIFVLERRGEPVVVDTNTAILLGADDEYRIRHPTNDGDEGTVIILPPHLIEDATGRVEGCVGNLSPRDHLAVCLVTRALREHVGDQLEAEDATFLLLASLSRAFATPRGANGNHLGPAQRLRIEQVRALLAGSPSTRWSLARLAQTMHCSPFHLARQFRSVTGESITQYLLRLRLTAAVERMAAGERNLATVALETGFAHHSHFSSRFRRTFGVTPAQARQMLTKRNLVELRAVLARCGGGG